MVNKCGLSKNDNNSFAPYKYNQAVEDIIKQANIKFLSTKVDNALDEKMYITNPEGFQSIVNRYLEAKNS